MASSGAALELAAYACRYCGILVRVAGRPLWCARCSRRNVHELVDSPPPASSAPLASSSRSRVLWATDVPVREPERARSNWRPWSRVTGELCRGLVSLLGGARGTGKTRLALTLAAHVRRATGRPVMYCPLEQKSELTRVYMHYLELETQGVALHDDPELETILEVAREVRPVLIVVDALKMIRVRGERARASSPAEIAAVAALKEAAERTDAAVLALLHNQASQQAYSVGADALQLCDLIVRLDRVPRAPDAPPAREDEHPRVRLRVDEKNRWGPDTVTQDFESTPAGLVPVLAG